MNSEVKKFKSYLRIDEYCEECDEDAILVAIVSEFYRCTNCGADTRQHINGSIRYMKLSESDKVFLCTQSNGLYPILKNSSIEIKNNWMSIDKMKNWSENTFYSGFGFQLHFDKEMQIHVQAIHPAIVCIQNKRHTFSVWRVTPSSGAFRLDGQDWTCPDTTCWQSWHTSCQYPAMLQNDH